MGGSQSTRKIIVEDDNGEGVVRISEAVVKRIRGVPEGSDSPKQARFEPRQNARPHVPDNQYNQNMRMEIENLYAEKLNDLHQRNMALQKQTNEQFSTAVKEVEQKFLNYTLSPICQDLQQKVLQCYQANPSETLNCSAIVTAFTSCVERARVSANINRPQSQPQVQPVS